MTKPDTHEWKVPIALRLLGSQPGQTPTVDTLVFVRPGESTNQIIVRDAEDLHYELWSLYPHPAHYSIIFAGSRYEYVRRMTEAEVLALP